MIPYSSPKLSDFYTLSHTLHSGTNLFIYFMGIEIYPQKS